MSVAGLLTFDTVGDDLEYELGGEYSDFEFHVSGALDDPSSVRRVSDGVAIGGFQSCDVDCSNGSNHRNYRLDDRIIKVQEYQSSSWVTVLEVQFVEAYEDGIRVNVITANIGVPAVVVAR